MNIHKPYHYTPLLFLVMVMLFSSACAAAFPASQPGAPAASSERPAAESAAPRAPVAGGDKRNY